MLTSADDETDSKAYAETEYAAEVGLRRVFAVPDNGQNIDISAVLTKFYLLKTS